MHKQNIFLKAAFGLDSSEETLAVCQEIFENMKEGFCIVTARDQQIFYANHRFEELFGYAREELQGESFERINKSDRPDLKEQYHAIARALSEKGEWSGLLLGYKQSGKKFWTSARISSLEHSKRGTIWVGIYDDVTVAKTAEMEAGKFEYYTDKIIENIGEGILLLDENLCVQMANPKFYELFGLNPGEVLGKSVHELPNTFTATTDGLVEWLNGQLADSEDSPWLQVSTYGQQGYRVLMFKTRAFLDFNQRGKLMLLTVADLTDRAEADERFRALMQSAPDAILVVSADGLIQFANIRVEDLFGYHPEDMVGKPVETLIPERFRKGHKSRVEGFFGNPFTMMKKRNASFFGLRSDGAEFPVEMAIGPLRSGGQLCAVVVVRDLTEQRVLEEELRQSQKLESLGRLAGGVAHDFNNKIGAILLSASSLVEMPELSEEAKRCVNSIIKAADKSAALTRQLLAFSRKQVLSPSAVNINEVIEDCRELIERLIGDSIAVSISLDEEIPLIRADSVQVEQVILNLCVNARDAMEKGGDLSIRTASIELCAGELPEAKEVAPGRYVVLTVHDTGAGIPEDMRSKIFEPFFTTKEVGRGTGLGLATVHGIVKQSQGHIEVDGKYGEGTIFRLYFPVAVDNSIEEDVQIEVSNSTDTPSNHSILVVDDEEVYLNSVCNLLSSAGYSVTACCGPDEARKKFVPGKYSLAMVDVVMPKEAGPNLARDLIAKDPALKIILMSGYTEHAIQDLRQQFLFVPKPISSERILRAVSKALAAAQEESVGLLS